MEELSKASSYLSAGCKHSTHGKNSYPLAWPSNNHMKHFTSVRVHPCQFKATAFHMHEQSHLKWLFRIKQVKSEQGWGRPEFCTRCWLLIYSLVKQECASSEDPETSGQHPSAVPCTSTTRFRSRLKGMSRQSKGLPKDHPTNAAGSPTSSRAQQTPSTSHLLETATYGSPYA